ncbi:MAG: hypothetical protein IPH16_00360 [Haliscomenobacter sp.]|nr:hypothetical protein [Haliscomenobacter sp.]
MDPRFRLRFRHPDDDLAALEYRLDPGKCSGFQAKPKRMQAAKTDGISYFTLFLKKVKIRLADP